eukprot:2521037-Pleurochrysis_carterae.AAC.1
MVDAIQVDIALCGVNGLNDTSVCMRGGAQSGSFRTLAAMLSKALARKLAESICAADRTARSAMACTQARAAKGQNGEPCSSREAAPCPCQAFSRAAQNGKPPSRAARPEERGRAHAGKAKMALRLPCHRCTCTAFALSGAPRARVLDL